MPDVVAKEAMAPEQKPARRSRWLAIASSIIVVGFIGILGYFGLKYFRDTSYQDERAFRVLGHVVGQFGNLQEAIAGAMQLAPAGSCKPAPTEDPEHAAYVSRLALRGSVVLRPASADDPQRNDAFHINTAAPERKFSEQRQPEKTCRLSLSGPLRDQIPIFINQELFESVAIATASGSVLTTIPQGYEQSQHVQLHRVAGTDLFGGDVEGLLRAAAVHEVRAQQQPGNDDKSPTSDRAAPASATVYAEEVGGQPFRIFVLPFEPTRLTIVDGARVGQLYLIGLKRQNVLQSLSDALGSGGALVVTLGVLLCVLFWPFISLRFSSPQEAIAPTQVIAILLALLLIPAVLATSGFSIWTRYRLTLWADQHAEIYARRVEQALVEEMDSGLHIIEALAQELVANDEIREAEFVRESSHPKVDCLSPDACSKALASFRPAHAPDDWAPIRQAAPLNAAGRSSGFTVSFFRGAPSEQLDLPDREYFQAIMQGEEWRPRSLWSHALVLAEKNFEHRYVAQRLFNRSDAARALQLSVPMDHDGKRIGLVTGDTRAYGLSAALRPPLLRFAIFDHRSGAVLFHTNDERSLAENLVAEMEGNSALLDAMQKRASKWTQSQISLDDHFTGRYIGVAHHFYHRAIPGAPWGLVVFYETDLLNTIVLQTAIATLATYFLMVIIAALVLGLLVIVLRKRADIALLRWVWPKWNSQDHYRMIARVTIAILVALALVATARLNDVRWLIIMLALLLAASVLLGIAVRTRRASAVKLPAPRPPSVTAYQRSYVQSVFGVLCLVSAVPAIVIAIGYHDTSVHAFIRDELQHAARDEEQRRRTLLRDDRRFNGSNLATLERAAELSRNLPVPGYEYPAVGTDEGSSWSLIDSAPAPWLFECGPPTLDRIRRGIWTLSTARQVQRPLSIRMAPETEACSRFAVRAWRRSEDGTRVSVTLPLNPIADEFVSIGVCRPEQRALRVCRDPELYTLYMAGSAGVLGLTTFGCALLTLLLSAHVSRRLFGVRIPFAGRFVPSAADAASASALLDAELELVKLKNTAELQMTSKDEADWRALKCRPIYQGMWDSLETPEEQLLLLHLAHGRYANPENQVVIEQLIQRGYVTLAPWPRIVEPGFADFIRRVHPSHSLDELRFETSHTPWSQWRTPILIVVIIIAGLLMWLAGSAMHILAGVLAGVATLFGSITQVTSFIHRDKPAPGK